MKKEEVLVVHSCNQTHTLKHLLDNTKKLSEIITGNGDPEKGISGKVAIIGERQTVMVEKLQDIHSDLNNYRTETEDAKEVALKVHSAFEKYKAGLDGIRKGKDEISTKEQVNFNNVISIIGTIVIVAGLIFSVITSKRADEDLHHKIDNLGTPVIINERGSAVPLSVGDSLKFYRNGEFRDTMRD